MIYDDRLLHSVKDMLFSNNDLKWYEFNDDWFDDYEKSHECYDYYQYYYAKNELYIIRNKLTLEVWFTKAKSPYQAYINHSANRCESLGYDYKGREYSYEDFLKDTCRNCQCFDDCDHVPIMADGSVMTDFRYQCIDFEEVDFICEW